MQDVPTDDDVVLWGHAQIMMLAELIEAAVGEEYQGNSVELSAEAGNGVAKTLRDVAESLQLMFDRWADAGGAKYADQGGAK